MYIRIFLLNAVVENPTTKGRENGLIFIFLTPQIFTAADFLEQQTQNNCK